MMRKIFYYLTLDKGAYTATGVANDLDRKSVWVSREMFGKETGQFRRIVNGGKAIII